MLAYAADVRPAARGGSPRALVLILAGHALLLGAVMSAKMGVIKVGPFDPTDIVNIPIDPPPPPEPTPKVDPAPDPQPTFIPVTPRIVDMQRPDPVPPLQQGQSTPPTTPLVGTGVGTLPLDPPRHVPTRIAAVFRTPDSAIRPPYPTSKLREQEEATLKLRLSIDERGRVISVEPVGAADPDFLAAARRHIIHAWRYKPATEDGVAVAWSTVITLSFRLEDA